MKAIELTRKLGGEWRGSYGMICCPAHNDRTPSCKVEDGTNGIVVWCYSCESSEIVVDALKARGLWNGNAVSDFKVSRETIQEGHDRERRADARRALQIFGEAKDPASTLAELYLNKRGLTLPDTAVLRFHPNCPRGSDRQPALIALITNYLTLEPQGIQRIFLSPDGKRDGIKMSWGIVSGGAIMISSWYGGPLYVAEGPEDAIALELTGRSPAWSLLGKAGIAGLPLLIGVNELRICADNDEPGREAALRCRDRWGTRARILMPPSPHKDWAEAYEHG